MPTLTERGQQTAGQAFEVVGREGGIGYLVGVLHGLSHGRLHPHRHAGGQLTDAQARPIAGDDRLCFGQKAIDRRQLGGGQIVQPLGANLAQIDFVQHGVEQTVFAGQRRREFFEDRHDFLAPLAFDHDDGVVFGAELLNVFQPQAIVVALGIDQIEPAGAITESRAGERKRCAGQRQAERKGSPGIGQDQTRSPIERPTQKVMIGWRITLRMSV